MSLIGGPTGPLLTLMLVVPVTNVALAGLAANAQQRPSATINKLLRFMSFLDFRNESAQVKTRLRQPETLRKSAQRHTPTYADRGTSKMRVTKGGGRCARPSLPSQTERSNSSAMWITTSPAPWLVLKSGVGLVIPPDEPKKLAGGTSADFSGRRSGCGT